MEGEKLHLEPSSRCTLACPQCSRTEFPDRVAIDDLDIELAARISSDFKAMFMVGAHGDPIYHPRFHELVSAVKTASPGIKISMHTNGAFRSESWWQKTATLFARGDTVTFSIDGLPRNNHLYRVNSRWNSVELGIKTLREHNKNVTMRWKWILFRYNQDDVEEGVDLAKKLGFNYFELIESDRYQPGHWLTPTVSYGDIRDKINACG